MENLNNQRRLIDEVVYDNLPPFLKNLIQGYSGREKDIILLSTLIVLSSSIPNVYGNYSGEKIYPHLYLMIIAPPASGKGMMNVPRQLITKIHDKLKIDSLENRQECIKQSKKDRNVNSENCPDISILIVPANISTSELYSFLNSSKNGLIMIESEADTLSKMLNNDWSNYSDVMRKAWHHEDISLSRKLENEFVEVNNPKLAMLISGTPDQLAPLIKNQSNGLFSRFMMYNFEEIAEFKDVFDTSHNEQHKVFKESGNNWYELYGSLLNLEKEIEFQFSNEQKLVFKNQMIYIQKDIIEKHSMNFVPNVYRAGIIWFRIAMILTVIREMENLSQKELIEPVEEDFYSAFEIMKTILRHSQYTFDTMSEHGLSIQDEEFLDSLKSRFLTKNAITLGASMGIGERTVYDKLKQLQNKKIIKRIAKGKFRKL